MSYVGGNRRYLVAIVIKSQSQSQGRDRGEKSTYATPRRDARAFACCSRVNVRGQVGEIIAARCETGYVTKRVWSDCYVSLLRERAGKRIRERGEEHAKIIKLAFLFSWKSYIILFFYNLYNIWNIYIENF